MNSREHRPQDIRQSNEPPPAKFEETPTQHQVALLLQVKSPACVAPSGWVSPCRQFTRSRCSFAQEVPDSKQNNPHHRLNNQRIPVTGKPRRPGFAQFQDNVAACIRDGLQAPDPLVGYGYDTMKADKLPSDLGSALDALESDTDFADMMGPQFVKAFLTYKRNELERFSRWVTDWEFREYTYHL